MPAPVLNIEATVLCAHVGSAQPTTWYPRVLIGGQPVVVIAVPYIITGCALAGSGAAACATGQFVNGAARVTAGGAPVAIMTGTSICVPTGSPMVPVAAQTRVLAS